MLHRHASQPSTHPRAGGLRGACGAPGLAVLAGLRALARDRLWLAAFCLSGAASGRAASYAAGPDNRPAQGSRERSEASDAAAITSATQSVRARVGAREDQAT